MRETVKTAITRYDPQEVCGIGDWRTEMRPDANGDWVSFEDHEAIVARLSSALSEAVSRACDHCAGSIAAARKVASEAEGKS